ncbi:hypothetical protein K2173_005176 [Erythroxylum novogranatense]|uniref:Leucine-rich repeat-containing N-terminal plant-type domain-containing protein n=1 Tax=Erythroxylum novogranatense TaxID=1862640 RepID=A0AAV8TS36_9ROSI|nr:hypothetical protein K2173_005176 [Erythroxylum novogranatense]
MAGINYQLRLVVVLTMLKLLLLLLQGWGSNACWQEERAALLQLKASFNYTSTGEYYGMFTWRRDVDCCTWSGVGCNATTGRVYELKLGGFGSGDWYFNASMFLPFQELRRLSLPSNSIVCCVKNGDFERLSNTIDLEYLDLSDNKLGNSIFPFVAGFSSLKSLYVRDTALSGTSGLEELQKLNSLEVLDLSNNDLNNSTLPLLNGLHSLRILYMSNTQQKGSINMKDLVALFKLEELYIGGNNIEKFVVSKDVEHISNISVLWIENNICNGCNFELESLKGFPNVKTLNLENNILTGVLFPRELDNVKELFLDYSSFDENFLQSLAVLRLLRNLNMQSIHANSPALRSLTNFNTFLQSIENMTSLETLLLRGCKLTGSIHGTRGLCKLINLRELDLYDNNLNGNLPHCLVNLTLLQHLDLTNNHFTGKLREFK